jgi:hypothetical protein
MYFRGLEERIERFIQDELSPSEFKKIATWPSAPESIQNLLCLLGAEAARRHEWESLISYSMSNCTNPVFERLWDQWVARFEGAVA